ncbi:MAG: tRNA (adenosine(37)-N6)-threonylcarbamoyltransferase complex transferase subunit TsaD, partial [Actinomycetia bacterium]|nr:tRNA (adenosine(37)-N6)-threonylcarbamoyltransferase complex transferase subunit TsaD [Actinomycetes bacterium]
AAGGPLAQGAAVLLPASGFVQAFPLAVQPGVIPTTESALSSPAGPASIAESAQPAPAAAEFIFYRPMAAQDLSQVVQLERQCFVASPLSGECWTEANFQTELNTPQHSWWVAWQGQELAGYCGGWLQDGDLQVLDIAVDPSWRRRGIGRQLLQRLLSDARELGATTASLEVRPSNSAARAFYDDLGFQTAGRRPGYYTALTAGTAREDALLLVKDLQLGQPVAGAAAGGSGPINAAFPSGRPTADAEFAPAAADLPSAAIPAPCILALETSCDETAAAIINGRGELLANVVASQVDFHARFGGVVPEIASRKHIEAISGVVDAVIEQSGLTSWQQLQAVAVTYAPGLIGALVVGVAFAKGLAWAIDRPLVAVNHLEGHIYANRLAPRSDSDSTLVLQPQPQPPFIIALLSGGHTMLVAVRDWGKYQVLGQTLDDAVGEAFDKVAKALGLGYPGGPVISRLAAAGNPRAIDFPRALLHSQDLSFSLSGLKTAVISWIRQAEAAGQTINMADVAASFQQAVIDVQVAKARLACVEQGMTTFCLGGGVAANRDLREAYRQELGAAGIQVFFPPLSVCSDNAAMIAACALDRYARARFLSLAGDAQAFADLSQDY